MEAKATLTEPKDEINLKQPNVKEVSAETEVNSVGEYVYDTKLDNDEIHKEFWKKLKDNLELRIRPVSHSVTDSLTHSVTL